MALRMGRQFICPLCGDDNTFQENMLLNGVFIPFHTVAENEIANPSIVTQSSGESATDQPKVKQRRVHKVWIYDKTFENQVEAEEAVEKEEIWSAYYNGNSSAGKRKVFRCNLVKFRAADQCEAQIYLLYDSKSSKVSLFRSQSDHTHASNVDEVFRFSAAEEAIIRELWEIGTKPKMIKYNLVKKGFPAPPDSKFNSYILRLRQQKCGTEALNVRTLEQWLIENSSPPHNELEPFIVNHEIDISDPSELKFRYVSIDLLRISLENCVEISECYLFFCPQIRFMVSTKLLLKFAIGAKKIHADGTYKLNWHGFPVLLVGTTDMHRKFHCFGVAVSTHERTVDYEFIFNSLKVTVRRLFDEEVKPEILICDAAHSIHNAFKNVFGEDKMIVMCWAHMRKATLKKLPTYLRNQKQRFQFMSDVDKLQLSKSTDSFDKAADLFVKKWSLISIDLMQYFTNEWLNKNRFWYEGFAHTTPSTNNALESCNKLIKDENTFRERLDLRQFRYVMFDMVQQWSIQYDNGLALINNDGPDITMEIETIAYQWYQSKLQFSKKRQKHQIVFRLPAVISDVPCQDLYDQTLTTWSSFDDFKAKAFSFYDVIFPSPLTKENWIEGKCDCSRFFKEFICEHVLAIACRLNLTNVREEVRTTDIQIGQKRGRGRPAKAKAALVYQD